MPRQPHSSVSFSELSPFTPGQLDLDRFTTLNYQSGDLGDYLNEIVQSVSRLIQSDWTIVTLCQGKIGQVIVSSIDLAQSSFSVHGTLAETVIESGRSLMIEDSRNSLQYTNLASEYLAYLGVPLATRNQQIIGTICSFLREPRSFTESEVKVIESFAERAATAIGNFWLYQQQLRFNEQLSQKVAACSMDLKLSQEKLVEQERLAAIGEFTSMIVHEIRNPLTTIEMGLRYAQKVLQSDSDQQRLMLALGESHRLQNLLTEILHYAKPQVLHLSRFNLGQFFDDLLIQIQELPEAPERCITYINDFPEAEVMADVDKLKQVFLNLFRNAFEAIALQETVRCEIVQGSNPSRICIRIQNGGTPIPPELLPQITTPFCSTKPSGTGLGLAISKRIIVAHGGELAIASSNSGTTVSIFLPCEVQ
ncbi:ATP-binding protein [Leptolyngbya sp. AN03gr2]|uniref:GAF domain-containing sensor histidine kinase n=1 Tax=unclassified Leptolyngbya TaxID=2650499 RepID=UPI003D31E92C